MTLSQEKAALRRQAASLPPMDAAALLERFLALPEIQAARTVLLFYGVGTEPDTRPVLNALLQMGKRPALPVCLPGHQMEARAYLGEEHLREDRYGIPAPDETCPVIPKTEIDAVLVPHILMDREGYRLGHGGGFYDRFLADYTGFTAAVCPKERLVDRVPREATDLPVQRILTDR